MFDFNSVCRPSTQFEAKGARKIRVACYWRHRLINYLTRTITLQKMFNAIEKSECSQTNIESEPLPIPPFMNLRIRFVFLLPLALLHLPISLILQRDYRAQESATPAILVWNESSNYKFAYIQQSSQKLYITLLLIFDRRAEFTSLCPKQFKTFDQNFIGVSNNTSITRL